MEAFFIKGQQSMKSRNRLLFIDDDTGVLDINRKYFEEEGFDVQISGSPEKGMDIAAGFNPDLIVLDVMMPGIDGFDMCKKLRQVTNVPILFLSGKVREEDKIKGFECGADDYLEKPCSLPELKARIMANIRRRQAYDAGNSDVKVFGSLSVNVIEHKVMWQDTEINLSKREYQLLSLFTGSNGKTLTFGDIGKEMLGVYTEDDRRIIMVQVSRLRKKLEAYTGGMELIETVWSKGYRFVVR